MADPIPDPVRTLLGVGAYAGTALKSAAAAAGVAPTVLSSLYRNRAALLAAAMRVPLDPGSAVPVLIAQGVDGLGERLVRATLELMDDPAVRDDLAALSAGASTVDLPGQVRTAVEGLQSTLVDPIAAAVGLPDARLRATLVTASLTGLIAMRYVLRLEPLASAPPERVAAMVGPGIQRLLDPRTPVG